MGEVQEALSADMNIKPGHAGNERAQPQVGSFRCYLQLRRCTTNRTISEGPKLLQSMRVSQVGQDPQCQKPKTGRPEKQNGVAKLGFSDMCLC